MLTASVIEVIRGCGILPISRGVEPAMVLRSAAVLAAEGISVIEVTLDSPDPYDTSTALRRQDGWPWARAPSGAVRWPGVPQTRGRSFLSALAFSGRCSRPPRSAAYR